MILRMVLPSMLFDRLRRNHGVWLGMFVVALLSVGLSTAASDSPAGTLLSRAAIAANPANRKIYAVDEAHDTVLIIQSGTGKTVKIDVGRAPDAVAVNPVTGRVYVANSGSASVSVLDGSSDQVTATVPAGPHPYMIDVNQTANLVYVTDTFSDSVAVIDGAANTSRMQKVGSADNVLVDPQRNRVLLLGYEDKNIRLLRGGANALERVPAGKHLWALALDSRTGDAYATQIGTGKLVVLRSGSLKTESFQVGAIPCAVAVNPLTHKVYVANYSDNTVTAIDSQSLQVIATIPVGNRPQALGVDSSANLIFAVNTKGDSITVIDGETQKPLVTLPAGQHPFAIAILPGSDKVWVANMGEPAVTPVKIPQRHRDLPAGDSAPEHRHRLNVKGLRE